MSCSLDEGGVLKLSSLAAGGAAAAVLLAPSKFQDAFHEPVRRPRGERSPLLPTFSRRPFPLPLAAAVPPSPLLTDCAPSQPVRHSPPRHRAGRPVGAGGGGGARQAGRPRCCTGAEGTQPVHQCAGFTPAHYSFDSALCLDAVCVLSLALLQPTATQRAALKAAGATWPASGLLNVYETADGQTVWLSLSPQRDACPCTTRACTHVHAAMAAALVQTCCSRRMQGGPNAQADCPPPAWRPRPRRRSATHMQWLPQTACWGGCASGALCRRAAPARASCQTGRLVWARGACGGAQQRHDRPWPCWPRPRRMPLAMPLTAVPNELHVVSTMMHARRRHQADGRGRRATAGAHCLTCRTAPAVAAWDRRRRAAGGGGAPAEPCSAAAAESEHVLALHLKERLTVQSHWWHRVAEGPCLPSVASPCPHHVPRFVWVSTSICCTHSPALPCKLRPALYSVRRPVLHIAQPRTPLRCAGRSAPHFEPTQHSAHVRAGAGQCSTAASSLLCLCQFSASTNSETHHQGVVELHALCLDTARTPPLPLYRRAKPTWLHAAEFGVQSRAQLLCISTSSQQPRQHESFA